MRCPLRWQRMVLGPRSAFSFFLKHASGLSPVTLVELPQNALLLNTPGQPEQRLYQLVPQEQLQQALPSGPQQPRPQGSSARGAASRKRASSAQPAVALNLAGEGGLPQPPAAVLALLGSAESQRSPGPSGPRPGHTLPPALAPAPAPAPQPPSQPPAPQPPSQPQVPQLRILQCPMALPTVATEAVATETVATETAGSPGGQQPTS